MNITPTEEGSTTNMALGCTENITDLHEKLGHPGMQSVRYTVEEMDVKLTGKSKHVRNAL